MAPLVYMAIYFNKDYIFDLYSILKDGYLESKSIKFTKDKSNSLKLEKSCKDRESSGNKLTKSNKKCYKDITKENCKGQDISKDINNDFSATLDNKKGNKNDISVKEIYPPFYLFDKLRNIMINENMIKNMTKEDIVKKRIECGDYVEFKGCISTISILNSINNLIDIIEAYDSKELDKLLKDDPILKNSITNYTVILNQLKNMSSYLSKNNTVNMIMDLDKCKIVLNVNINYFSQKNAYIYDNAYSSCNVLCKVINIADNGKTIDLFAKTGMSNYYRKFLLSLKPYLELLNQNNIIIPMEFITEIVEPAIQVIPIAIYV